MNVSYIEVYFEQDIPILSQDKFLTVRETLNIMKSADWVLSWFLEFIHILTASRTTLIEGTYKIQTFFFLF